MEWFPGSIVHAIQTAKSTQAYFVVYVEGTDDASKTTTEVLDRASVSGQLNGKQFICIKLLKDSEGHKQFAEIYKMVPIPSVFFIAHTGQATDVVVGGTENADVEKKILEAVQRSVSNLKTEGTPPPQQSSAQMNQPAGAASAHIQPSSSSYSSSSSSDLIKAESSGESIKPSGSQEPDSNASTSLDEKVEKAKQLISLKNEEKRKEEVEKEKASERERRRIGQEMHKAKLSRQEQEMKEALEERKKNVSEDAAARKKILDQIAQDRAERLERQRMFSPAAAQAASEPTVAATPPPPANMDSSRIQFRLPSGETKTHVFPAETTLMQIREFIDNNIVLSFNEYFIATTFPRREFTWRDNDQDLRSLELLPSGVLLVLPVSGNVVSRPNGWAKAMISLFWSLVTPFLSVGNYVTSFIFGGGAPRDQASQSRPQEPTQSQPSTTSSQQPQFGRTTIRKRGNIHTLADDNDNKDDNNTWNGNSTQQM